MELSLKLKALSRMARSNSAEATAAIQREIDKATSSLTADKGYEALEEGLSLLKAIGFRNSAQTVEAIGAFVGNIEQRELTYALGEDAHEYQDAASLITLAIDVLREVRYLDTTAATKLLLPLAHHSLEEVRKKAVDGLEEIARYNIDIFYGADRKGGLGPQPQRHVIDFLSTLDDEQLKSMFAAVVNTCGALLSPSMSASSWSYRSVTLMSMAVPGIETVVEVRAAAISLLKHVYSLSTAVNEKIQVIGSLSAATRSELRGGSDATAAAMIEKNTIDVMSFYTSLVGSDDLPVVQRIESLCYWTNFHASSADVKSAALAVKIEIDKREEYAIYRVLIGFEGIFAEWTDGGSTQAKSHDVSDFRKAKAREYAESINSLNYSEWRDRILAYARVESTDLATFPVFFEFLNYVAIANPDLAFELVTSSASALDRFLIPLLRGLLVGTRQADVRTTIEGWIEQGAHLYPALRVLESNEHFDLNLAGTLADRAIEDRDVASICAAIGVAAENVGIEPLVTARLFVPALFALTDRRNTDWVFDLWFRSGAKALISNLDDEGVSLLLRNLLVLNSIDFHAEEILFLVAQGHPKDVLEFLSKRVAMASDEGSVSETFDAIPYQLHKLDEPLSRIPAEAVRATRDLYDSDSYLFEFRGARLLQSIFPEFSPDLEEELIRLVRTGSEEDIEFVVDILSSYDGETFIHRVAQEIVRAVPSDSPAVRSLAVALQATGVVTGEFGFVTAYSQKIDEIGGWAVDGDERILAFVKSFVSELELRIALEKQRAEESIALRKHQYGEGSSDAD